MTNAKYQICVRCVMDTTDPHIRFDEKGICNHCHAFDIERGRRGNAEERQSALAAIVATIRHRGHGYDHDCILGVSGGVDSSYLAWLACQLGLRPLAVHLDGGWNSETAVRNIQNLVTHLNLDLVTYVVDWEEMRALQAAFFRAGVANADIPQDHAINAALYHLAAQYGLRYILTGTNSATESCLPRAWGHTNRDLRSLKGIYRHFGGRRFRTYPTVGIAEEFLYYRLYRGIKRIAILDYVPYSRHDAATLLQDKTGWSSYGDKHHESVLTRFFQAYYLPQKFGFDKRRAHLSSRVLSGEISRGRALAEMTKDPYSPSLLRQDSTYICDKLGILAEELEALILSPGRSYRQYPSSHYCLEVLRWGLRLWRRFRFHTRKTKVRRAPSTIPVGGETSGQ